VILRWYPIIDYEKCVGCLSCAEFCPHDVFTVENNLPIVTYPEKCVEFCRGCQKGACDYDAISFPGDKKASGNDAEVSCECLTKTEKNSENKEEQK